MFVSDKEHNGKRKVEITLAIAIFKKEQKVRKAIILLQLLLINLVLANTAGDNIPLLVGYWKFDELSGRIAADSSDNKNDGQLVGGVNWVSGNGKFNGAVSFDGKDNAACIRIPTKGMTLKAGTIVLWARLAEPQSKNSRGGYGFLFGARGRPDRVQLYINEYDMTINLGLGDTFRRAEKIEKLSTETWYHIALTWDGNNYFVYLNGVQKAAGTYIGLSTLETTANIGNNGRHPDQAFHGIIDEVAVFDQPLKENEIAGIYHQGVSLFVVAPGLQAFVDAPQKAESIPGEGQPQKAIAFLEEKIAELKKYKEGDSNDTETPYNQIFACLYFQLARTKEVAGLPKEDIAATYKLAVTTGVPSLEKQSETLWWLYNNVDAEAYENIIQTLIQNNNNYLKSAISKIEALAGEQKSKTAIKFLEGNLSAYSRWQQKNPSGDKIIADSIPAAYFQLAKIKEISGMPKKDIADAYSRTFSASRLKYVPERTAALVWLLDNDCNEQTSTIIRKFTQDTDANDFFKNVIGNVCRHFESEKNKDKYERVLNALFAETKHLSHWAVLVESCIADKTSQWAKNYFNYIDGRPELKFARDCGMAERYAADGKFREAAELYKSILTRNTPADDKVTFEFRFCECLFKAGEYGEAVPLLEKFIASHKAAHRNLVKEAMLMRGCANIQLDEVDKAVDDFFILTIEYPGTKEAKETNYFLGYCYMLQGKFRDAEEAFNSLLKSYPDSPHAEKARRYLARINIMTKN